MIGALLFQTPVFAEVIYGEIINASPGNSSLSVRRLDTWDTLRGHPKQVRITIPHDTEFQGVHSLEDLKTGDRVLVDVSKNEVLGGLEANTVEAAVKLE